jgi:acyl-CoA hydrolase
MSEHGPKKLEMTSLMTPDTANFAGKVHGGDLLKLLDEVAYSCAARYSGEYVVTLLLDDALFRAPVHVGELVSFKANVNWVGDTSMEVGIRVDAENHRSGETRHVMSCYFVMVCLGEDGEPIPVPKFALSTEIEKRRWREAEQRRQLRKENEN